MIENLRGAFEDWLALSPHSGVSVPPMLLNRTPIRKGILRDYTDEKTELMWRAFLAGYFKAASRGRSEMSTPERGVIVCIPYKEVVRMVTGDTVATLHMVEYDPRRAQVKFYLEGTGLYHGQRAERMEISQLGLIAQNKQVADEKVIGGPEKI